MLRLSCAHQRTRKDHPRRPQHKMAAKKRVEERAVQDIIMHNKCVRSIVMMSNSMEIVIEKQVPYNTQAHITICFIHIILVAFSSFYDFQTFSGMAYIDNPLYLLSSYYCLNVSKLAYSWELYDSESVDVVYGIKLKTILNSK